MAVPRTVCSHVTVLTLYCLPACTYGSSSHCVFQCNCADPAEVCDMNSGECSVSGCKEGLPDEKRFRWSGPGCRVGKIHFSFLTVHLNYEGTQYLFNVVLSL